MQLELNFWTGSMLVGAVLAVLLFLVWGGLLISKALQVARGTPPNAQLQQSVEQLAREHKETRSRLIEIERWRHALVQKLDDDKHEILTAGEHRKDELQKQINELPDKIVTDMLNSRKLFELLKR